ncbi:MAG: dihydrolipoyl dehydrogenase [Planctomycetes bacterium]|nr:dihydrolipoyl dehydrogenase [Planctomycetota bacterium]
MYDVIILGAGPAGYVAAEHASAMGKTVLLVEQDRLGGVCLNRGCIPTKSFLHAAKLYNHARHGGVFGVVAPDALFDYGIMKTRTEAVQEQLRNGIAFMMKRGKVEVVQGVARIVGRNRVAVGGTDYAGTNILIATGSRPAVPPIPGLADNPAVVDSTALLQADTVADSLAVIGGGVIGVEFACFHALLGKSVTVLEMLPTLCGPVDRDVARAVQKKLEQLGASVHVGATVDRVDGGTVFFRDKKGIGQSVAAERILVAAGRKPNLEGFGLDALGLDVTARGITVNDRAETSVPGVYAAGDVTGRIQLAHFASRQATVAVHAMFGRDDICRDVAVPAVIYTDPEAAGIGLTEHAAKEAGIPVRTVKMPLAASGRFVAETDGEQGFIKAVLAEDGKVLGMHIVGSYASEMIAAAAIMIEYGLTAQDVEKVIFPHPTVAEIMREVMFL